MVTWGSTTFFSNNPKVKIWIFFFDWWFDTKIMCALCSFRNYGPRFQNDNIILSKQRQMSNWNLNKFNTNKYLVCILNWLLNVSIIIKIKYSIVPIFLEGVMFNTRKESITQKKLRTYNLQSISVQSVSVWFVF